MTKDKVTKSCELCGTETNDPVLGWGNEKPTSEPHWFCSTECRTEFVIAEEAMKRGIGYTIRKYYRAQDSKVPHSDEMDTNSMERMEKGEILDLTTDGKIVMSVFLDPFDEIKIW